MTMHSITVQHTVTVPHPILMCDPSAVYVCVYVCVPGSSAGGVRLKSYRCAGMQGDEEGMLRLLATQGPVAVGADATSWQDYVGQSNLGVPGRPSQW